MSGVGLQQRRVISAAAATEGELCFFHANPNKAVELGRIGGRKNGHARSEVRTSLPALETTSEVRETVARLIQDLYSGKVRPRVASGLASLLNLQLRVLETSSLERRVAQREKLLARTEAGEMDLGEWMICFPSDQPGRTRAWEQTASFCHRKRVLSKS